jgi:RND family efflux transporter MFP subunit
LEQVRLNSTAEIAKAKVALDAANRQLKKEEERLARYQDQLTKCEIHAEQDGMVAYATPSRYSRSSTIAEGALLRERQHILSLPNLKLMQVKTAVHESVQNQIEAGLPVTVRIDAFPDQAYTGTVKSIGVLPDQKSWHSSDTKMYETYVTIDEEVENLKPGMTAMVEIHIDEIEDVISVPVQAVQQEEKETFLYVERDGRVAKQLIEVGRTNDKFVEITVGLSDNERVVLNPLAVVN